MEPLYERNIPVTEITLPFSESDSLECYGFGYDLTTQDYKVIVGYKCKMRDTIKLVVFTLKTNLWRIVEVVNPPVREFRRAEGCLLNGALHWLEEGIEGKEISTMNIISSDFSRGKVSGGCPIKLVHSVYTGGYLSRIYDQHQCRHWED